MKTQNNILPLFPSPRSRSKSEIEFLIKQLAVPLQACLTETQYAYYTQHPQAFVDAVRTGVSKDCRWRHAEGIDKAVRFIEANLHRKLRESDVASIAGMSTSHFCAVFKEQVGESFVRFVNRLRVERAKSLLRGSADKIGEVADSVGCTFSRFCILFKRHTRQTALQFRH